MDSTHATSSAYYNRLLLLGGLMVLVVGALSLQLFRLTVTEGAERRADAERALVQQRWLKTYRGSILDRNGVVLAADRPGWALKIRFPVISGEWVEQYALIRARDEAGATVWNGLDAAQRSDRVAQQIPMADVIRERLLDGMASQCAVPRRELDAILDTIDRDVSQLARNVHARQRAAEARERGVNPETYRDFKSRPIREQVIAHTVIDLDDETAFRLRSWQEAFLREQFGPDDEPDPLFEVSNQRRRLQPFAAPRTVALDPSSRPGEHETADASPVMIEVNHVAGRLIGDLRDVWQEDVERRPFRDPVTYEYDLGGYRVKGERAGRHGLERGYEAQLRGRWGERREQLDTGAVETLEPEPGEDLDLTIDIELQSRITAILDPDFGLTRVRDIHYPAIGVDPPFPVGWPLAAGAVVLEVRSGEILAMVSSPPTRADWADKVRGASLNRAVEVAYPPGSIAKPLMYVAAVTDGKQALHDPITCTGHYFPGVTKGARCWCYRERYGMMTHGSLGPVEAIARSCNIFFYTLADRLGFARTTAWYRRYGAGTFFDLGLGEKRRVQVEVKPDAEGAEQGPDGRWFVERVGYVGESAGRVASAESGVWNGAGPSAFDTVILGIGQGQITWTPLHAANAYAILARGGEILDPVIARHRRGEFPRRSIDLDPGAVRLALEGMKDSVGATYGTGHYVYVSDGSGGYQRETTFRGLQGVTIFGKTGTAQTGNPRFDLNGDGVVDSDEEQVEADHSWYVVLVGPENQAPKFAIAVVVEFGGSGGRAAGPVVHQIIRALQYHGYLPGGQRTVASDRSHG